jgi:GTPase Era involved in 16S rRNA processing
MEILSTIDKPVRSSEKETPPAAYTFDEPLSIDEIIDRALLCAVNVPHCCDTYVEQIKELKHRLSQGRLHLAVLGQFNRGKSTFLNALIGLKILPTSVLPITSVPTIISYDQDISCRVRFVDGKPDLFIRQSVETICETLKKYVAEDCNPKNELCVKNVEITCPSQLLMNGTVLIDTPGFGSTHIHNTKVALDTLSECDAAIFLLSADPPLTQTELEFLKQVNKFVPRIFFVLNKVDLLSAGDLATVDKFIKDILIMQMKYPVNLKLYHICAVKGERARGDQKNESWQSSGMDIVKSEILDFMTREKYFTLSEALNEKFHEALDGIDSVLQQELINALSPITLLEKEYADFSGQISSIKRTIEKTVAFIPAEKDAIVIFYQQELSVYKDVLYNEIRSEFDTFLNRIPLQKDSVQTLASLFTTIISEKIIKCYTKVALQCNKPLQKVITLHAGEFSKTIESVKEMVDSRFTYAPILSKLEALEISTNSWKPELPIALTFDSMWSDMFKDKNSKIEKYRKQMDLVLNDMLPLQLQSIENRLYKEIDSIFRHIQTILEKEYGEIRGAVEFQLNRKETALYEKKRENGSLAAHLKKLNESYQGVKKLLV